MKIAKHDLRPLVSKEDKPKPPHNKGQKDEAALLAEEHNINVSTLRKRKAKHPDVPLEVLARRPVMNKRQAGSAGGKAKSHNRTGT